MPYNSDYEPDYERIVEDRAYRRYGDTETLTRAAENRIDRQQQRRLTDADWELALTNLAAHADRLATSPVDPDAER